VARQVNKIWETGSLETTDGMPVGFATCEEDWSDTSFDTGGR